MSRSAAEKADEAADALLDWLCSQSSALEADADPAGLWPSKDRSPPYCRRTRVPGYPRKLDLIANPTNTGLQTFVD